MLDIAGDSDEPIETLLIACPVCRSDEGETLGVVGPMDGSLGSKVVMRCEVCDAVYLTPGSRNEIEDSGAIRSARDAVFGSIVRRVKHQLSSSSRVLCVDGSGDAILVRDESTERFDSILMPLTLESTVDPNAIVARATRLLDFGGSIHVIVGNADSSCFNAFGGRHWFGYRFLETRQHFGIRAISVLAANNGLKIAGNRVVRASEGWLVSIGNVLQDWNAPPILCALVTGRWFVPRFIASLLEIMAQLRGRGSVLIVALSKT